LLPEIAEPAVVIGRAQARRQVMPGARLLSGLIDQATKLRRSNGSSVSGAIESTSDRAAPTASAICVSSVTSAGWPVSERGPADPYSATICS
jgi:hypothetical protein